MATNEQLGRGLAMGTLPIERQSPPAGTTASSTLTVPAPAFGVTQGRIDDVNELAERLVGRSRTELIGMSIADVVMLPANADVTRLVGFIPATAGVGLLTRLGALSVGLLVCPGAASSLIIVVYPDTRLLPSLRDDDVADIVHDLKNPLASIALDAELLTSGGASVDVAASVRRIARNVGFLDRMIHDLLDLCALQAGHFELCRSPTELRALVEQVLERIVSVRDQPRLVVYVSERVTLEIDDLRIERVIANFITNALKYAPPASVVVVRLEVTPACARLSVIDAGPGVAAVQQAAIFDRYRRGPSRGRDSHGLGLYVSKRIVDAHGGRIGVESVHGAGSRFFFELPRT